MSKNEKSEERKLVIIPKKDRSLSVATFKQGNDKVSNVRRNLLGLEFNRSKKKDSSPNLIKSNL